MPSTSPRQKRFMAAAAHSPSFARKAGIKQSVAKEFNHADREINPQVESQAAKRKKAMDKIVNRRRRKGY